MNPLFDRRARERLEQIDVSLSQAAAHWRRAPSADLRARTLARIDAAGVPSPSNGKDAPIATRTLWLALAAAVMIAWLAWQAGAPPRRSERVVVHVSADDLFRRAREQLSAPSMARSLDQPLFAEAQRMRSDARRAVDFLVARVSLPVGTRAQRD